MTTTSNFKSGLDKPQWYPVAIPFDANLVSGGEGGSWDMRNDATRNPLCYWGISGATGSAWKSYNPILDGWSQHANIPASAAYGFFPFYHSSQGPRGTIAAGATTTSITLTTAMPASIPINGMANRGDGTGFRIRIIGNAAGSSGKIEEVTATANTSGTTPTITFTPALTFTPAIGDAYEILSGRIFCVISSTAFYYYEVLTQTWSSALSTTNLTGVTIDSCFFGMSELLVSSDRAPGDGFLGTGSTYNNALSNCCVATAISGTTITSAALTAPSTPSLYTNEYRNFQIRIVEDTGTPTAVGQRRNITSHTSGNTPVFTVPAWSVTPSATAKFVVEMNDDRMLLCTGTNTNTFNYTISTNAWDTATTWAACQAGGQGSNFIPCFGMVRDATGNRKQGSLWRIRGGGGFSIDLFDWTAAATGTWTAGIAVMGMSTLLSASFGTCALYDPITNHGKYALINHLLPSNFPSNATTTGSVGYAQLNWRFDVLAGVLVPATMLRYATAPSGTTLVSNNHMMMGLLIDGAIKISTAYLIVNSYLNQTNSPKVMFALTQEI